MNSLFPVIKHHLQTQNRPFWSVMIPTYNPSSYLEQTLRSVIQQNINADKMQIEIVDDNSPSNSALEIIYRLGLENRVRFFRQKKNLGLAGNWNSCIERAQGEIVHILHQDDYILPGFYTEMEKSLGQDYFVGAAFCRCQVLDENHQKLEERELLQTEPGVLSNWLETIATKNRILTPSIVVRRIVYEKLGGFYPGLFFALDWEMWVRIANSYNVWYVPQILATYRTHMGSETSNLGKSVRTVSDIRYSFEIRSSYLPTDLNSRTKKVARRNYAKFAFRHASNRLDSHQWRLAGRYMVEGLKCSNDLTTIVELLKMISNFIYKRITGHSLNLIKKLQA